MHVAAETASLPTGKSQLPETGPSHFNFHETISPRRPYLGPFRALLTRNHTNPKSRSEFDFAFEFAFELESGLSFFVFESELGFGFGFELELELSLPRLALKWNPEALPRLALKRNLRPPRTPPQPPKRPAREDQSKTAGGGGVTSPGALLVSRSKPSKRC